jgi:ABC-2 type transport system permease protein
MSAATGLLWRQIRYQNKNFWRTPAAAFFTLALPVMFLLLFSLFFGDEEIAGVPFAQFFTPAIAVFAAVSATFTNLAIGTALSRDQGILKRVRGTPLPAWIYMAGRIGSGVWIALISVVLMFSLGWLLYDFQIVWGNLAVAVLVFVVGMATFSALGLAVCAVVKNGEAVPAVAQAVILPMAFISDIFIQTDGAPEWLTTLGNIFPLKHFVNLFSDAFNPFVTGSILGWGSLAAMAGWLVFGLVVTTRFFSWDPRGE